jgi:acyl-CoA thioester hydrolase
MTEEATYRGVVYPWQCDHIGHMNIMWYVSKFDEANWNFLARLGLGPAYMADSGCDLAGVQQNLSYKREMFPGNLVEIRTSMIEIRTSTMRFLHVMLDSESGETTATCDMTAIHLDREARKATPWPADAREAALRQLELSEAAPA